jgi:hypothetical protein
MQMTCRLNCDRRLLGFHRFVHMTSQNLWDWKYESSLLFLTSDSVIDAAITAVPVLILYIILQKYIVASVQTTGLKG